MNMGFAAHQLAVFICLFLVGIFMGFVFDVVRAWEKAAGSSKIKIFIIDLLSCIFFGFFVFYILFLVYWGELRFFVFLAVFVGAAMYYRYCSAAAQYNIYHVLLKFIKVKEDIFAMRRIVPYINDTIKKKQ